MNRPFENFFLLYSNATADIVIPDLTGRTALGKWTPLASAITAQPCQNVNILSRRSPYMLLLP